MRNREHEHRWHHAAEGIAKAVTMPLSVVMILATVTSIVAVAASTVAHMAGA